MTTHSRKGNIFDSPIAALSGREGGMRHTWPAAVLLLVLLIGFRLLSAAGEWANFSPLPAVFLCCIVFFRGTKAWVLPIAAWLLSNPIASWIQSENYNPLETFGAELTAFISLLVIGALALPLRKKPQLGLMIGAGIGAALLFHFITGVGAWLSYPAYPKNLTGLEQSLWSGPVGSPLPSWVFLRNAICSNVIFTLAFALSCLKWPALTSRELAATTR
ncbi:MAG: DUF6580 family putative transport protein [Haloferula sp.]